MSLTSGSVLDAPARKPIDQLNSVDGWRNRARRLAHRLAPALGLFGAVKLLGFTAFMFLLHHARTYRELNPGRGGGAHPWDVVASWDGPWYRQIAEFGYDPQLNYFAHPNALSTIQENSAAFFPLYPALIRFTSLCTGLGTYGAGMVVAVVSSFAAAAGIYLVAAKLGGPKAGVIAAAIWGFFPGSGVEWAVYSDSLFVALSAWSCYAVMTRRWLTAGSLALIAGLNRPTAGALIAAVGVAALIALFKRQDGILRPLAAIAIMPWGLIGYLLWVGWRMGDIGGYFKLERGAWARYFDFGKSTFQTALDVLLGRFTYWLASPVPDMIAVTLLLALPFLIVLFLRLRPPVVLIVYTVLTVATALSSHQIFSNISRYLLPAFTLFIPLAFALRRLKWGTLAPLLCLAGAASGWFAGYALFELGIP